eukprot:TRINITY_DN7515_c0_g2_i2.p1 TRINITY_DN7515_c0_g2~~TRINITY_DN7515_c0_g2_i2.p1  ORF type:complete len:602 (-),score=174.57 TRINITY_DN7515_c0_g2_i2:325-2130(-)
MKSIMRWGKAALSRVEEVVAPLNSLPPEKAFERSWGGVVDFYHNVASSDDGDPLSAEDTLGRSNIMLHLDRMVQLLKEEELNSAATMTEGDVGPCMTVLLQKKIVDNLCALGQADRPPGMMPLVLDTMQQLLECSRQGLMDHHGQITDPVHKLIQSASSAEGTNNKIRLLHLVQTMFTKIQHKPELMEYSVERDQNGELTEFFMFSTLVEHINDPDEAGVHARKGALTGIRMAESNPSLLKFIAHTTTFCSDVAIGIANAYSAVLQLGQDRFQEAERHGAADYLRDQITFLRALGQCEPEQAVALVLIRQLDMAFVEPILCKSLLTSTEENRGFALDLCRALITQLGPSSIRTRIVTQLLGSTEVGLSEIGQLLLSWLSCEDVRIQQSTFQLLSAFLNTRDETVMSVLIQCPIQLEPAECGALYELIGKHLEFEGSPEETEKALKDYREEAEAALYLWEVYDSVGTQPKDPWEESFVSHVLTQLSSMLALDLDVAVILTGVASSLAQCPNPALHKYLFGGEEPALTTVVSMVCGEVSALMDDTPDSVRMLGEARRVLDEGVESPDPAVTPFKNVIVWHEFLKELLATLEMKNMVFALQLSE